MSIRTKGTALISEEDLQKAMEKSLRRRTSQSSIPPIEDPDDKYRQVFSELDLDGDGFIGKEELRVCLALMGQPVREETLDTMIRLGDLNGDELMDFEEFRGLMANPKPRIEKILKDKKQQISDQETNNQLVPYNNENKKSKQHSVALKLKEISLADLAKLDPVTRRMKTVEILHAILGTEVIKPRDIKILHKKFQEADSKKSGKLTLFQFEKIFDTYRSIENRRLKSIYVSLLFAFCDSDNSNQIDAKEFIIGLCWLSDFGNIEKLRFAFVLFDANGNGRMDREELVQLIASINMGRDSDRSSIVVRVDELFRAVAPVDDWRKYELSFEQLVAIADANSDLFQAL